MRLERLVRQSQRDNRIPAVQVALHRSDRPLWTFQVGTAGPVTTVDELTQFRIGSVTKTFTAVLLMQCRDDGLLDLDDPVSAHLKVPRHGGLTLRRLLSHTSGLQREPYGDIWDTLATPGLEQTLAELARAERVLPPARRFHYSNLGFALLGQVVAAKRGGTWAEVLADRVLRPLRLETVTVTPNERAATGYLVDAYSDHARPEPVTSLGAVGPAGELWSTAGDMARWAAFLADPATVDPVARVLAAKTLEEMRYPLSVWDDVVWRSGLGLGLILTPREERVLDVGHSGAMPGFLADVSGRCGPGVPAATGAAVLVSSGTGVLALDLSRRVLDLSLAEDPPEIEPWLPDEPAPEAYRSVLGRWWGEGFEYVFAWRDGQLEARGADAPRDQPPAVFATEDGPDLLRTVSGREIGERLRLTRDAEGRVVRMHWATYRFTRAQETFDGIPASCP
ncbi:MAG TPA: serine hydrolase domain-containing protein [Micromonosporaceae bacterium]|nr:serine hydrolase domain-containing protein [Micromonosporaceae bacterium]